MAKGDIGKPRDSAPLQLPAGGTRTDVGDRASSGYLGQVLTASGEVWMGPGPAPAPTAPAGEPVRRYDYPSFWNVYRQPSNAKTSDGGIDFYILREFAKQTLVRLAIETCKDLDEQDEYIFTLRPAANETSGESRQRVKRAMSDPRVAQVSEFFDSPDGLHDFAQWRRLAWEEILVADNLSIYKWPFAFGSKNRGPYALRIIDGDTIEPVIDDAGYEPRGTDVAYEQWIKGQPRTAFTADELLYAKFNPRTKHVLGLSPTEQVLMYINILIRRDMRKLAEYTDGNIPAGLWSAPDAWTPDQIVQAQQHLDQLLTGDPAARSKLIYVPGGARQPVFPGERVAADSFDDLLARIICYAYSVPVSSLLKEQNRATAQTTKEQAEDEGVRIRRTKMTRFLNRVIRWAFGYTDIIAIPKVQTELDAAKQAETDERDLKTGKKQLNEIRERDGDEPIPVLADVYGYFGPNGFTTYEASIEAANAAAAMAGMAPVAASAANADDDGDPTPDDSARDDKSPVPQKIKKKSPSLRSESRTSTRRRFDY
jgi:hypothetical protein